MEELQQQQEEQFGPCSSGSEAAADEAAGAGAGADASASPDGQQQANGSSSNGAAAAAAAGAGQAAAASSSPDEINSDGLDYEAEQMSQRERRVLAACLGLLAASAATLRAFGKALLQGPALVAGGEALEGWESCLFHARHLRRAAEDLGAAMYPPQVCARARVRALVGRRLRSVVGASASRAGGFLCALVAFCAHPVQTRPPFDPAAAAACTCTRAMHAQCNTRAMRPPAHTPPGRRGGCQRLAGGF